MDVLGFIASIIDSLAWPAAIVVLVLILQTPIRNLLKGLTRLRYKDVEIDFGVEIQQIEDQAKTAGLRVPERLAQPDDKVWDSSQIIANAARLAADFPEPAVGLAWTAVEHELWQALVRLGIAEDHPPLRALARSISMLHEQGYLDDEMRKVLSRMQNLRNMAVHGRAEARLISPDDAREFIALTEAATDRLRSLKR